jgi:HEAT repeat protein
MQYDSLCVAAHQTLTAGTCPWCGHAIINGHDWGPSTEIRSRDIKAAAVARIRATLKDSNPLIRAQTAAFLGGKGADAAEFVPDLTLLLQDADQSVRDAAAQAIKDIEKRR